MERRMIRVTLRDTWIREQTPVQDILVQIKKKKWARAGYVVRQNDNHQATMVTEWLPRDSTRSRGGPITRSRMN